MKCVHCGQRKGKRRCPALGGDICPQCCGEHRLKTIACPPDCVHLGGLAAAAVSDADVEAAVEPALFMMSEWYLERREALPYNDIVVREILDGAPPEDPRVIDALDDVTGVIGGCTTYGVVDGDGRRAVDRYLAARGRELTPAQGRALKAMGGARFGVFLVEESFPGEGYAVRDVAADEVFRVKSEDGTPRDGAVYLGFVATLGAAVHPVALATVPDALVDDVADAYRAAVKDAGGAAVEDSAAAGAAAVARTPAVCSPVTGALVRALRGLFGDDPLAANDASRQLSPTVTTTGDDDG